MEFKKLASSWKNEYLKNYAMLSKDLFIKIFAVAAVLYMVAYFLSTHYSVTIECKDKIIYKYLIQESQPEKNIFKQEASYLTVVKQLTACNDKKLESRFERRGHFWVLYNYVPAQNKFKCHESITITTHADYSFLDNLIPLVEKWQGPVSVALHASGYDYEKTIDSIAYLRFCTTPLIRELVTFHIYFEEDHMPEQVLSIENASKHRVSCRQSPPYESVNTSAMYKSEYNLLYPVNVGRNIARETAQTHYIFANDIELYPSPNIIPKFLKMIAKNQGPSASANRKIFILHLFEIYKDQRMPENKETLQRMLNNKTAIIFHQKVCPQCHNMPKTKEWIDANETESLDVFYSAKRHGIYNHWEPIYIGTNSEPFYDERLHWEGKSDKMSQGYILCMLDYDFLILDNVFLVHRPGVKIYKPEKKRDALTQKTNSLIRNVMVPELKTLYGTNSKCKLT